MPRSASISTAVLQGIEAIPAKVTATVGPGPAEFCIEGAGSMLANDMRAMVGAAMRSSGYVPPLGHVHVTVEPSSELAVPPLTTSLELPMALAILAATEQIDPAPFTDTLVAGSLDADGGIGELRGVVSYMGLANAMGKALVAHPQRFQRFEGVPAHSLATITRLPLSQVVLDGDRNSSFEPMDLEGFPLTKLAMMCSTVGSHPLLLGGCYRDPHAITISPWWVANGIVRIMPIPSEAERDEMELIHSACGAVPPDGRPVRMPHHSITLAGMVGGGRPIIPGEVSLAHGGVLLMDDVEHFDRATLAALEVAVSCSEVSIARSDQLVTIPSEAMVVMATQRRLTALPPSTTAFAQIVIDVDEDVALGTELRSLGDLSLEEMSEAVADAKAFQAKREVLCDTETIDEIGRLCSDEETVTIDRQPLDMSRMLSVSRTIADIDQSLQVCPEHVRLAASLCGGRSLPRAFNADEREPILIADEVDFETIVGRRLHEHRPRLRRM